MAIINYRGRRINNPKIKEHNEGVEYCEDSVTLYHITRNSNVPSILSKGLIPNRGKNRKRCRLKSERVAKELWISFCKESEISSWKKSLYKDREDITVLKVKVPRPVKYKWWNEGWEFGYFGRILPENIEIYHEDL